eukprot:CAMPEP_0185746276 /NCGR_PEP_ID=MMETSP1174-20130828/4777_1 /TAXON_ID=35687 /ORGANISM="Dictyocha speculum, Strain CCMP1381" /LENGTH=84 /DNA_ID=CAMNT_0028420827 /DNA_START=108 /DNA_END=358 /DNA_ORIENTATION=-
MPVVLLTQVAKGLAYPINGVVMGGLDWRFSTLGMWGSNLACLAILAIGRTLPGGQSLSFVWGGLAVFMWGQCLSGVWRFMSGTG